MKRFDPIGGGQPPEKPAPKKRAAHRTGGKKTAPVTPKAKAVKPEATTTSAGISSSDFLAMLGTASAEVSPTPAAEPPNPLGDLPVGTAVVGGAIADAFGMRGLPNTIVVDEDFTYLHKFLYHDSPDSARVPADLHLQAMALCDGYGKMTADELTEKRLTWDWSHIRDSKPEAIKAASEFLRQNSYKFNKFCRTAPALEWGIRIDRAEGVPPLEKLTLQSDKTHDGAEVFKTAHLALCEWGKSAPEDGCYDKCDVRVDFPSGEFWEYRFDLKHDGTEGDGETFLENLRQRISFYAGLRKPDWMTDDQYAGVCQRYTPEQVEELKAILAELPPPNPLGDKPAAELVNNVIAFPSPAPAVKLPSAREALAAHLATLPAATTTLPAQKPETQLEEMFGTVVYAYTRTQAIEDGVLVSGMTADLEEISRQHFKWPIAMTASVWALVESAASHPDACADIKGTWHDILWMAKNGIFERITPSIVLFHVAISSDHAKKKPVAHKLKFHCGPGDNAEPVITIMQRDED